MSASVDSLTFLSCTDTIPLITISSCHIVTPLPSISITASGTTGGTISWTNTYVRCNVSGGTSGCYYFAASASNPFTNSGAVESGSGISVTHSVPSGGTGDLGSLCGTTGSFNKVWLHFTLLSGVTISITI